MGLEDSTMGLSCDHFCLEIRDEIWDGKSGSDVKQPRVASVWRRSGAGELSRRRRYMEAEASSSEIGGPERGFIWNFGFWMQKKLT